MKLPFKGNELRAGRIFIFLPLIIYYPSEYNFLGSESEIIGAFIVTFTYYNLNNFKPF